MIFHRLVLIFYLVFYLKCAQASSDKFHEELFIKPLNSGHVYTYFQFTTQWFLQSNESFSHTHLVARPLAEIFSKYDLMELRVSLTNGLWRYEKWGYPVLDAAPGAEVLAWFNADNRTEEFIDEQWKELCGILSGLLCASLSFIENSNTVRPEFTFRPTFSPGVGKISIPNVNSKKYLVRYATLPREIVCTENLTPWIKLLPGDRREGLMSLLNAGFIHTTNYHSLGLHVRRLNQIPLKKSNIKPPDSSEIFEIKQTVNLVFDTKLSTDSNDWSLRKLFGQGLNGASELADTSLVYVDQSDSNFRLIPEPSKTIMSQRGGSTTHLALYDIKKDFSRQMFSISGVVDTQDELNQAAKIVSISAPPPLYARRYLLGVGLERGKIVTKITNKHWSALNVVLQESLPCFIPVYLHTLSINMNGATNEQIKPKAINYVPGRLRERPSHLEVAFEIPGRSTVDATIDFDYVFLKWLEYPPDANHGHYIGSNILTSQIPVARNYTAVPVDGHLFSDSFNASRINGYFVSIRTESLLITLPTPDFSMPYNVICLACTVVALAFGPIHNFSTKKLTFNKKGGLSGESVGPKTLLNKLNGLLSFIKRT